MDNFEKIGEQKDENIFRINREGLAFRKKLEMLTNKFEKQ